MKQKNRRPFPLSLTSFWRSISGELARYFLLVAFYFFAFGMQFVLFPSLVAFKLQSSASDVGWALLTLQAPMFLLLLFGGVFAERAKAGPALFWLQFAFALPPILLAGAIGLNMLTLPWMFLYGIIMGSLAGLMMPVRDAALNGVVYRGAAEGGRMSLATAAAFATAMQFAALVCGLLVAGLAENSAIGFAPLLLLQAASVLVAALFALSLKAPKPLSEAAAPRALSAIKEGVLYAFRHPIMWPMLLSAAYVGVFVVGAFQVLFPLIVRDAYGASGQEGTRQLRDLYVAFWTASFLAAALLGRLPAVRRPGRVLLICHMLGGAALLSFMFDKPAWAFVAIVAAWGFGSGISIAVSRAITQSITEPSMLGRVLAVYSMGFMGGGAIGSGLVGLAAQLADNYLAGLGGVRAAALIPAAGLFLGALILALATPLWRLELTHDER